MRQRSLFLTNSRRAVVFLDLVRDRGDKVRSPSNSSTIAAIGK
ncbi:hypothetical protein [Chroococcidiopsis sp. CCALA 051]|nr:hypothetical protein [Chroococcidiopsis sp. CCALA 051]